MGVARCYPRLHIHLHPKQERPVWFGEIDKALLDPRCTITGKDGLFCNLGSLELGGSVEQTVAITIGKAAAEIRSVPAWTYRAVDSESTVCWKIMPICVLSARASGAVLRWRRFKCPPRCPLPLQHACTRRMM